MANRRRNPTVTGVQQHLRAETKRDQLAARQERLLLGTAQQLRQGEEELEAISRQLYIDHQQPRPSVGAATQPDSAEPPQPTEASAGNEQGAEDREAEQSGRSSPHTPPYSPQLSEEGRNLTTGEILALRAGFWTPLHTSGIDEWSGSGGDNMAQALNALAGIASRSSDSVPEGRRAQDSEGTESRAATPVLWKRVEEVTHKETTTMMGTVLTSQTISEIEEGKEARVRKAR